MREFCAYGVLNLGGVRASNGKKGRAFAFGSQI